MEMQRIRVRDCKDNLEVEGLTLNIKTYCKPVVVVTVWYWPNNRHINQQNGIKSPITGPHICGHFIVDEDGTEIVVFSVNDAELIGYSWVKK